MNYYYVGQKVSHQAFGDGEVKSIQTFSSLYPIEVHFDNGIKQTFTFDGRLKTGQYPSLSQQPHVPLGLKEIVTFEKGELVWVKTNVNDWNARYFSHFLDNWPVCFTGQEKDGMTTVWKEIRKFKDCPLELFAK